jgi:hypothetical protein
MALAARLTERVTQRSSALACARASSRASTRAQRHAQYERRVAPLPQRSALHTFRLELRSLRTIFFGSVSAPTPRVLARLLPVQLRRELLKTLLVRRQSEFCSPAWPRASTFCSRASTGRPRRELETNSLRATRLWLTRFEHRLGGPRAGGGVAWAGATPLVQSLLSARHVESNRQAPAAARSSRALRIQERAGSRYQQPTASSVLARAAYSSEFGPSAQPGRSVLHRAMHVRERPASRVRLISRTRAPALRSAVPVRSAVPMRSASQERSMVQVKLVPSPRRALPRASQTGTLLSAHLGSARVPPQRLRDVRLVKPLLVVTPGPPAASAASRATARFDLTARSPTMGRPTSASATTIDALRPLSFVAARAAARLTTPARSVLKRFPHALPAARATATRASAARVRQRPLSQAREPYVRLLAAQRVEARLLAHGQDPERHADPARAAKPLGGELSSPHAAAAMVVAPQRVVPSAQAAPAPATASRSLSEGTSGHDAWPNEPRARSHVASAVPAQPETLPTSQLRRLVREAIEQALPSLARRVEQASQRRELREKERLT